MAVFSFCIYRFCLFLWGGMGGGGRGGRWKGLIIHKVLTLMEIRCNGMNRIMGKYLMFVAKKMVSVDFL